MLFIMYVQRSLIIMQKKATVLIKKAFKKAYLFNPDPIHKALWNIACNCVAVKSDIKRGIYIWQSPYKMVD